jgi:hypothetical protein
MLLSRALSSGAVGRLLYYTSKPARNYILRNGLFLWPTGLIIIVTYGHDLFGYAVTALSSVLNIALYAAAVMLCFGLSVLRVATAKH